MIKDFSLCPSPHGSTTPQQLRADDRTVNTQAFERHEQYAWQIKLGKTVYIDIHIKRHGELEIYNHFFWEDARGFYVYNHREN